MQPIRSANDTAEFRRNYGANEFMNALYALDSGHRGQGVTVAVIDDGAVNVNGELDGRIDTALSKDFGYTVKGGIKTKRDELGGTISDHGTAVANIIAANVNGIGTVGYAPSVKIAVLRISEWDEDDKTETLWYGVQAIDFARQNRIKLINLSLTSDAASIWRDTVSSYAKTGGLVINAAGNSGGDNPHDAAAINDDNRHGVIFVGALSSSTTSYQLAGYSNKAGNMADRYVVAVGSNVTTSVEGNVSLFSGTSSATPVVTALAATILSKWPQLNGQQAGEVILATAKDIGAPGADEIFGSGLVDFKAALSPINPTLSNGTRQTSLQTSLMTVPSVMRVGSIQTALSDITILDEYGRDFSGSIADMVIKPEMNQGHWLRRRIEQMGPRAATSLATGRFASTIGFVSNRTGPGEGEVHSRMTAGTMQYVAGGYGLRAGWNAQESMQNDVIGLAPFADGILAYAPQAGNSFGIDRYAAGGKFGLTVSTGSYGRTNATAATLGWSNESADVRVSLIDENGSIMGTPTGDGALRFGRGATTAMIEAHQSFAIGAYWQLGGYGSLGVSRLKIDDNSLVTGASAILSSRIGLQATGPALGGLVSFGVAQPLAIESGSARLTYGSGYDLASRSLKYNSADADLKGDRRLQLTAGFSNGGPRSSLRFGVMQDLHQRAFSAIGGWSIRMR